VESDSDYRARAVTVADLIQWFGGVVIDPLALGWYADADLDSLFTDGAGHPNQQGHALIAKKLAQVLAEHGIGAGEVRS
jgi:lysophospholipase L1-like esterase